MRKPITPPRAGGVQAALALATALLAGPATAATLTSAPFGATADGKPVTRTTMATDSGVTLAFISYGGTITSLLTPDRQGHAANIVLGFPTLRDYETKSAEGGLYFGAIIGRYTNFIAGAHFRLGLSDHQLAANAAPNSIHGGEKGFDKQVWTVEPLAVSGESVSARLTYVSPDGEEGYPGTLTTHVTYTLAEDGAFTIQYEATTDRDTVVNLTNHANFNLAGVGSPGGVFTQVLTVDADRYTPTDAQQIPLGALAPVAGTPFDFRQPTPIGARIRDDDPQLALAQGYDQNWVLNKHGDPAQPQLAVHAYDPLSGRTLDCLTTEPGVQIYTANFLTGAYAGNGGRYRQTDAFTLETQHFPDSPNHPDFPSTELRPGEVYRSTTVFRFGTDAP